MIIRSLEQNFHFIRSSRLIPVQVHKIFTSHGWCSERGTPFGGRGGFAKGTRVIVIVIVTERKRNLNVTNRRGGTLQQSGSTVSKVRLGWVGLNVLVLRVRSYVPYHVHVRVEMVREPRGLSY